MQIVATKVIHKQKRTIISMQINVKIYFALTMTHKKNLTAEYVTDPRFLAAKCVKLMCDSDKRQAISARLHFLYTRAFFYLLFNIYNSTDSLCIR